MDSTITGLIAGAVIAFISGSLALIATNFRDFQRRWNEYRMKNTMQKALGVLDAPLDYNNDNLKQAASVIAQTSKREGYATCFEWDDRERQAEALGKQGGIEAVDCLKRMLKDKDVDVRIAAVMALGKINNVSTASALVLALRDKSPYIRSKAVTYLAGARSSHVGDIHTLGSQYINDITSMLNDPEPNVRRATAEALGFIGESAATSYLVRALKDEQWYVRREVTQALGRIGDVAAIPYLIRAFQVEEDPDIREAALTALQPFDDPRVAEIFQQALQDKDNVVRTTAAHNIGKVLTSFERNVLIVSGMSDESKAIVDVLCSELSKKFNYTPLTLFDLGLDLQEMPTSEAVSKLAHMARFVIMDVRKDTIAELPNILRAGVPIAFVAQAAEDYKESVLVLESRINYRLLVAKKTFVYKDADDLINGLSEQIIEPLEELLELKKKLESTTLETRTDYPEK
ncbi:MAG: HEAT repeat domain-containing protein [Halobacteriota archaeon]